MAASINQQKCIDTIDKPVVISAGAGSGKTFTLTERIVQSLMPDENGNKKISSISEVVAITFTHKAAEELKSRIRHRLNECGLTSEALNVDDAYISTIHSFAARILSENALQFCIAAKLEMIDESEDSQFFKTAFEIALNGASQGIVDRNKMHETLSAYAKNLEGQNIDEIDIADFLNAIIGDDDSGISSGDKRDASTHEEDENKDPDLKFYSQDDYSNRDPEEEAKLIAQKIYSIFASLGIGQDHFDFDNFLHSQDSDEGNIDFEKILEMTHVLLNKCSSIPEGVSGLYDEVDYIESEPLCETLDALMREGISHLNSAEKLNKTEEKYLSTIVEAQADLKRELESFLHDDMYGDFDRDFIKAMRACGTITNKFRSKADDATFWANYRIDLAMLLLEFLCSKTVSNIEQLSLVCKNTDYLASVMKAGRYFSNNDLLKYCYSFLKQFPDVAKDYRDKFKMIMIDEFQDTDRLQLAILGEIADEGYKNVCTVGDLQQSIYRFRSADVNSFRSYRDEISRSEDSLIISLDDNYRSHRDILALTDKIFSNNYFFGDEFLHLNAKGAINNLDDCTFNSFPRVRIDVVHNKNRSIKNKEEKCSNAQAREYQAKKIASYFKELLDRGCKPNSFALLLGKMTNAQIYQKALNDVGIESLISGGSVFKDSIEAKNVRLLVNLARNFLDDQSLLSFLKSDIINLSDDSILCISRKTYDHCGDEKISRCNLSSNIFDIDDKLFSDLSVRERQDITFAQKLLTDYVSNLETIGLVESIRSLLTSAGVFDHLMNVGPSGLVAAGNYEKSLHILCDICTSEKSIPAIQEKFNAMLDSTNERPGVLTSSKSTFMEIMTIHASKGLEFDHVAIAEIPYQDPRVDRLIIHNYEEQAYFSLVPNSDDYGLKEVYKRLITDSDDFNDASALPLEDGITAGELRQTLMKREREDELDEQKRLLYVAITRAVKSVFLSIQVFKSPPKEDYKNCGLVESLYKVFKWDKDSNRYSESVDFGGSKDLEFNFEYLPYSSAYSKSLEVTSDVEQKTDATHTRIVRSSPKILPDYIPQYRDDKYYSYSTLAEYSVQEYLDFISTLSNVRYATDEDDDSVAYPYDVDSDKATDFGTIFHAFMERLVMQYSTAQDIKSDTRLANAVQRTISSESFERLVTMKSVEAEMPFFIKLERGEQKYYLRGSIDLVGCNDYDKAYVIDYKTGTHPKDHSLQGKIYAYALLKSGFSSVEVDFLHTEIPQSDECIEPAIQHLSLDISNIDEIEEELLLCIQKLKR